MDFKFKQFVSNPRNLWVVLLVVLAWAVYASMAVIDLRVSVFAARNALAEKQREISELHIRGATTAARLNESRRDVGTLADKLAAKSGTLGKTQDRLAREKAARAKADLRSEGAAKTARAAVDQAAARAKREAKK